MDLELTFRILMANLDRAITGGIMTACAIIFFVGALKKAWLGKIKNEDLRKAVLWITSLVCTLPGTALCFLFADISFRWYWYACVLMCFLTTIMYAFYENTGLRKFIHWVGEKTVGKYVAAFFELIAIIKSGKDVKADVIQNKLTKTTEELKEEIKAEFNKQYKEDPDLKNV